MADEVEPSLGLSCARCASRSVRRHESAKSVGAWFGGVALLFVLALGASGSFLTLMLVFMFPVVGIGAVMALFSAAFGKNRCKDCGHKWR